MPSNRAAPAIATFATLLALIAARPLAGQEVAPASPNVPAPSPALPPARVLGPAVQARLLPLLTPPPDGIPDVGTVAFLGLSIGRDAVTVRYALPSGEVQLRLIDPDLPCDDCPACASFRVLAPGQGPARAIARWVAGRVDGPAATFWTPIVLDGTPGRTLQTRIAPSIAQGDPGRGFGPWFRLAQVAWFTLFAALLVALWPGIRAPGPDGPSLAAPLLFAGSLLLRLVSANWGPGDMHLYFPAFYGVEELHYGAGPDPILIPLLRLLEGTERTVIVLNLLAGALCPVMLLAFLDRARFSTPNARLLAAIVLMFLPLPIRHSGEGNRHAVLLFLGLASLWGLAVVESGRRWLGATVAVSATLLTFMTRPEGALILGVQACFLASRLHAPTRRTAWMSGVFAAGGAVFLAYLFLYHLSNRGVMTSHSEAYFARFTFQRGLSPATLTWLDPRYTPFAVTLAAALGAVRGLHRRSPEITWVFGCLLGMGWFFAAMPTADWGEMQLTNARYQTLSFPLVAILAGEGGALVLERLASAARPRRVLAWLGLAAVLGAGMVYANRLVLPPTDVDHEYLLMKQWVRDLPPDSEVHFLYGRNEHRTVEDFAFPVPFYLSRIVRRPDVTWHEWPFDASRPGRPRFFFLQSACAEAPRIVLKTAAIDQLGRDCLAAMSLCSPTPFRLSVVPYRVLLDARPRDGSIPIGLFPFLDSPEAIAATLHSTGPTTAGP